ncbi:MAG: isochorismatase family cysteine hydrolase [Dehalococcoidia bacterium]
MPKPFGAGDLGTLWRDNRFMRALKPVVQRWEVVPEKTALLVLDMNYVCAHRDYGVGPTFARVGLKQPGYFYDRIDTTVIPNMQRLLSSFRESRLKVIYTTMGAEKEDLSDVPPTWRWTYPKINYHRSLPGNKEFEIRDEVAPRAGEPVLVKRSCGAFATTGLQELLVKDGLDTLVVTGVETDCCVYLTSIEACDRGFKTIVLRDATTSFTETGHTISLDIYGNLFFFNVRTTDEVLGDLARARTAAFAATTGAPAGTGRGS